MQQYNVTIERNRILNGYSNKLITIARKNNINLDDFFQNYKGIEGYTVSMKTMYSVSLCIDQVREVSINCYGFDIGIFDIDCYSFSSIYNEIIFSSHNYFSAYKNRLNSSFLFSTYSDAFDFLQYHKKIDDSMHDVEHTELLSIYRVLKQN